MQINLPRSDIEDVEDVPSNSRTFEFVLERRNFLVFLLSRVCNSDFGLKSALIRRKNAKILLSGAVPKGVPINYIPIETANLALLGNIGSRFTEDENYIYFPSGQLMRCIHIFILLIHIFCPLTSKYIRF